MADHAVKRMTVDEFLVWEDRQEPKYELVDGRPVMMTGATVAHGELRFNICAEFRRQLRGKPGRAHLDLRVVCENGNVRFPDTQIDCGPTGPTDLKAAKPVVVVEVVSPSSMVTDYVSKVRDYGTIPSVSTYLIFRQDTVQVTVLRRLGDRLELEGVLEDGLAVVELPEVGVVLRLGDVYEEGEVPTATSAPG